jgi:hypothetical protein
MGSDSIQSIHVDDQAETAAVVSQINFVFAFETAIVRIGGKVKSKMNDLYR